jgi:hypothetical protein
MPCGSCLCAAITFEVTESLTEPDACHCSQCRRQSGHYWASTDVARGALKMSGEQHLTWFRSSERVRRGFCSICGSVLLWDADGRDRIAVAMGAFDAPTGTRLGKHIFTAEKGDYYEIGDDLPQEEGWPDQAEFTGKGK